MADVFVSFTAGGTAKQTATALLTAASTLTLDPQTAVRVVENGFITTDAVADEAEVPRYPAADCPEA